MGYNQGDITKLCLDSLRTVKYDNVELWLINNGSKDNTSEIFNNFKASSPASWQVNIKTFEKNEGAIKGRNYALESYSGKYILFLDNDVIAFDSDWLSKMVARMEVDKQIGAICPKLIFPKPENLVQNAGCAVSKSGKIQFIGRGEKADSKNLNVEYFCQCAISACLLINGEAAKLVGLLDTEFSPVQFEDLDYCYRLREKDYKILYYPKSSLYHLENITTDGSEDLNYRYLTIKNGLKFKDKWRHIFIEEEGPLDAEISWLDIPKFSLDEILPQLKMEESKTDDSPSIPKEKIKTKKQARTSIVFDSPYLRFLLCLTIILSSVSLIIVRNEVLTNSNWHELKNALISKTLNALNLPQKGQQTSEGNDKYYSERTITLTQFTPNNKDSKSKSKKKATNKLHATHKRNVQKNTINTKHYSPIKEKPIAKANIIIYLKSKVMLVRSYAKKVYLFKDLKTGRKAGKKINANDQRTPIGKYLIIKKSNTKTEGPILLLNYPNKKDIEIALKDNRLSKKMANHLLQSHYNNTPIPGNTQLGGNIKIKTRTNSEKYNTTGNIELKGEQMKKLYAGIGIGTIVWIVDK